VLGQEDDLALAILRDVFGEDVAAFTRFVS
jgi:hypothetical protein